MVATAEVVPTHIPSKLVFDFDYVGDPMMKPDPFAGLAWLGREAPPVFFTPRHGGHWVVQGHQSVYDISRNVDVFSSLPRDGDVRSILQNLDPPRLLAFRNLLLPIFAPNRMRALEPVIREFAAKLADAVATQGHCEFIEAVAEPLPVIVFMNLFGLPLEHMHLLRQLVMKSLLEPVRAERTKVFDEIAVVLDPIVEEKRRNPGDDIISLLVQAEIEGKPITRADLMSLCNSLTAAGLDTVVNAMGFIIHSLARDPELQATLRADKSLISEAVEELLRRHPVANSVRYVASDFDYGEVPFRSGERILLMFPGASFDATHQADPERIDLERNDGTSLVFGVGPHRCVGSHLARIELAIMLEEWLARVPPFRLDPRNPPQMYAAQIHTVEKLPLVW